MSGKMLRSSFRFNKIWIIESLDSSDTMTGTNLYNDLIRRRGEQLGYLHTELAQVTTLADLVGLLGRIKQDVYSKAHLPFLHFEIHGNERGLVLASKELVTWVELANLIREINIDTRNNVMVTTAVCFGGVAFTEIDPTKAAPFVGIIGPFAKVHQVDIEAGFHEFFDILLSKGSFDAAFEILNQHGEVRFHFIPSLFLFDELWSKIIESLDNPDALRDRVYNLTFKAHASQTNTKTIQELVDYFTDWFTNHRDEMKDEFLDEFLMRKMEPLNYDDVS